MISEPPLPDDLRALFAGGVDVGRTLSVPLPPGRSVAAADDAGGRPGFWLSDGPAPAGLWARLRAEHDRSGLWPLLLDALDDEDADYRPWGNGEVTPGRMSSPAGHDPARLLERWWGEHVEDALDDTATPAERDAVTAPYGSRWPGLAPGRPVSADAGRIADGLAEEILAGHPSVRLGLVAVGRAADAVTVVGWQGPTNYTDDTAELSAVLRSWEERFGARVVAVGFATLLLSVAAPPTTRDEALAVAAEHFALCPDNIWQDDEPHTLARYAERLVGDHSWTFWWD
ncbi:DUF4253 domain-containing protein [Actinosynnema sp. NPDC047251]|uniref:DUF4253 domain-containing protein n=1 Tax=Saccharothrix espanaensis (strain ATCC 51144 / DSM 44229 / JCM 9112 / NBRC 15066 / NRRL 15764) TaxID=1179773 RepID=K0K184_SACES|nr:DUF4253 domain-containing protein [Saccharothrix espanaensis]CCH32081.1 hypothetical protein BN6_48070 [Saccharothrix espanaensis DSM 44229]